MLIAEIQSPVRYLHCNSVQLGKGQMRAPRISQPLARGFAAIHELEDCMGDRFHFDETALWEAIPTVRVDQVGADDPWADGVDSGSTCCEMLGDRAHEADNTD
jgi:hypothetical protein